MIGTCKLCQIKSASFCKGLCHSCYDKIWYLKNREKIIAHQQQNLEISRRASLRYYYNNPTYREKVKERAKIASEIKRYGQSRSEIVKLLGFKCYLCGTSNKKHIEKFGISLNIHHIDGNGRTATRPNNAFNNLQLICQDCHVKLHHIGKVYKKTSKKEV